MLYLFCFVALSPVQKEIDLLGHDSYIVRESAMGKLENRIINEEPILPLLENAIKNNRDAEVRFRCRSLANEYWRRFYDVRDMNGNVPSIWDINRKECIWMINYLNNHNKIDIKIIKKYQSQGYVLAVALQTYYYNKGGKFCQKREIYQNTTSIAGTLILIKDLRDCGLSKERIRKILSKEEYDYEY